MAFLKIAHFWSNLLAWGYQHTFANFMETKTLVLCVGGFHTTAPQTSVAQSRRGWWCEIPMVKRRSRWGEFFHNVARSGASCECVKNDGSPPTFPQLRSFAISHSFVTFKGWVPAQFSNLGVPAHFFNLGVPAQFSNLGVPGHFFNMGVPAQFSQPCMAPSG